MATHASTKSVARSRSLAAGRHDTSTGASSGVRCLIAGNALLGTIGIFVNEADVDPITATWFRCAFGLLGLTLWLALRGQLGRVYVPGRVGLRVLAAAALMVLSWLLFFAAIERSSAGMATVLFNVQPLWLMVLAAWWLKEPISKHRVASVVIAMAGLALATGIPESLIFQQDISPAFGAEYWIGVAFCLAGAFCTACVALIARQSGALPAGVLAWWQCVLGTLVLLAWPIAGGWPQWEAWPWLSGLGLIHTGLAYALLYAGMARVAADRVAVFQFIYPALTILIDWLLYGYRLSPLQLAGIAVMGLSIWFAERFAQRGAAA